MFAPNLVYATLPGYYPRLLADDGLHEPLVLPPQSASTVEFVFYSEQGQSLELSITNAIYIAPDGSSNYLPIVGSLVNFSSALPAGGTLLLELDNGYAAYPIKVLRAGG